MATLINFSAQFGGRDAAKATLPHFKALKKAAKEITLLGFPFPKLAFILRVDGEINSYGFVGPANIDLDNTSEYVSVDIGIDRNARDRLDHDLPTNAITESVKSSIRLLASCRDPRLRAHEIDFQELEAAIQTLCRQYEKYLNTDFRAVRESRCPVVPRKNSIRGDSRDKTNE